MARPTGGYVKWYRKLKNSWLGQDGYARAILDFLVRDANRYPGTEMLDRQLVTVDRAELATSLDEIFRNTGFSRRIIIERLHKLEKDGVIRQKVSKHGRIISISNYDNYQVDDTTHDTDFDTTHDTKHDTHIGDLEKRDLKKSEKSEKKPKPKKERLLTWTHDDPYAKAFENLKSFPAYWAIFDLESDRKTLESHRAKYVLTIADLEQVTYELRHYMDGPRGATVVSPRGTLATFVKNFAERRAKRAAEAPAPIDLYAGIKFRSRAQ